LESEFYLILGAPLIGAVLSWLFSLHSRRLAGVVATAAALCSAIQATLLFKTLPQGGELRASLWQWFTLFGQEINMEFAFDSLAAVMCLVITWVGTVIHLYSVGYMAEDEGRFFAYLNLFLFSMLVLVLGASLPIVFIGWEGVGLCSYLLIGFWYQNSDYAKAGQKAFIANRVGDAGFILGMLTLAGLGLSLSFSELRQEIGEVPPELISVAAIALFLGAAGKSAQIPLFTWLPDAMAGPTPVSALIHAATMVTAGVYLFARLDFLLVASPAAQALILSAGALTALVGATSALAQSDIKKVLAYSTVSQLGFMFMALGAGAPDAAVFHVVTHAFFKALLFLSAGSVIHGTNHEQSFDRLGGLWKKMPITFACYLVGTLAIAGLPLLSGAYSKDLILERVYLADGISPIPLAVIGRLAWAIGILSAGLTACYMVRSLILTFFGKYRGEHEPHESPPVMLVPLVLLALPSLFFGGLYGSSLLGYLGMVAGRQPAPDDLHHFLETVVISSAGVGALLAVLTCGVYPEAGRRVREALPNMWDFASRAWAFDELYEKLILRPLSFIAGALANFVDRVVIDGMVSATGVVAQASGELTRRTHTGVVPHFILSMIASLLFLIIFIFLLR
jgi:NADH-quinone oxidoreductase subunit L